MFYFVLQSYENVSVRQEVIGCFYACIFVDICFAKHSLDFLLFNVLFLFLGFPKCMIKKKSLVGIFTCNLISICIVKHLLGLFQTPCCATACQTFFIQHTSDRCIKLLLGLLGRAVLNAFERRAARLSTALARRLK